MDLPVYGAGFDELDLSTNHLFMIVFVVDYVGSSVCIKPVNSYVIFVSSLASYAVMDRNFLSLFFIDKLGKVRFHVNGMVDVTIVHRRLENHILDDHAVLILLM